MSTCPGRGQVLPARAVLAHPYIGASPACWADPREGPKLHKPLTGWPSFRWLEPPSPNGHVTVADVLEAKTPAEHERVIEAWARDVWAAWKQHHRTVREWIERAHPNRD